jgi:hypothetical protein
MRAWHAVFVFMVAIAASAARAETVEINGDYGGVLVVYQAKWEKLAKEGAEVRISGPCVSACTALVGYFPRDKVCATPTASMGFHQAIPAFVTPDLWKNYPDDFRDWITKKGGLTYTLMWLQPPEIYKFIHQCDKPFKPFKPATKPGEKTAAKIVHG